MVNSLFGRISTCRIAFPLLDARSDPGIQLLLTMQSPISLPEVCQCPQRAYFHFYNLITLELPSALQVSMPSTGLLPFPQKIWYGNSERNWMCQCPQRAYFHFYIRHITLIWKMNSCVNALNGLTSISTKKKGTMYYEEKRVNALNGLTSISTVASRNPWFYWLPRAIFTSN